MLRFFLTSNMTRVIKTPKTPIKTLIIIPNFRFLWISGCFDNISRWGDALILALLIFDISGSAFHVASLFVLRWIPMLLFAPVSGFLSDHLNRKLLMMSTRGSSALIALIIIVLLISNTISVWHLQILSFGLGLCYTMDFAARRTSIHDVATSENMSSAMSLEIITNTFGKLAGPLFAGTLIAILNYTGAMILILIFYTSSLIFVSLLKFQYTVTKINIRDIKTSIATGIKIGFSHKMILGVFIGSIIYNGLAFSAEGIYPVIAEEHLNAGPFLTGLLISALGAGTLVGALMLSTLGNIRYQGRLFITGIFMQLLAALLFSLSDVYLLSYLCLFIGGLGNSLFSSMQTSIVLVQTDLKHRGAVLGTLGQCIGFCSMGGLIIGFWASHFGVTAAVSINGTLGIILIALLFILSPLVRQPIDIEK
ncbi:MAG TPA: hypothetical protein DEZ08_00220 [Dehalococcoidia bacterium]|nr:hypothetical protein [Dehalococcoidia bacterium]